MDFKKIIKIACIVIAVAGAICGIVLTVKKLQAKKAAQDSEENYVSCSCCEVPENM